MPSTRGAPRDAYANGSTTIDAAGTTYIYDAENQLIKATKADGTVIAINYDVDGNRVNKTVTLPGGNATATTYLVDSKNPTAYTQLMEEWSSLNGQGSTLQRTYVYGLDLISQKQISNAEIRYFGHDGLESIRYLADINGTITDTYTYDAYGIQIASTDVSINFYHYAGELWDPDLQMYYLRARYYRPDIGRFWTMDTFEGAIQDPLSLHKYLYCKNNPVTLTDPSGNDYSSDEEELGYEAEPAIQQAYLASHPLIQWPSIQFGQYQYYTSLDYLKPDIFNKWPTEKTFLEIKPISWQGIRDGQLKVILNYLSFGPTYKPDIFWQPPHFLTTPSGVDIFAFNVGGVVYYQDVQKLELAAVTVAAIETTEDLLALLKVSELVRPALVAARALIIAEEPLIILDESVGF